MSLFNYIVEQRNKYNMMLIKTNTVGEFSAFYQCSEEQWYSVKNQQILLFIEKK